MAENVESNINSRLYGLFRKQLNLPETSAMAASIEFTEVIRQNITVMKDEAINLFRKEMGDFKLDVNNKFSTVRMEFKSEFDIAKMEFNNKYDHAHRNLENFKLFVEARYGTKEYLANVKAELIRWMFAFWVAQLGAMVGIIMIFFRK